jgi:hypothetical protein
MLKFFIADPGSDAFLTLHLEFRMEKFDPVSEVNIKDPQHWFFLYFAYVQGSYPEE